MFFSSTNKWQVEKKEMNRGLRDISTNCNGKPCLNPISLSKDIYETIEEM